MFNRSIRGLLALAAFVMGCGSSGSLPVETGDGHHVPPPPPTATLSATATSTPASPTPTPTSTSTPSATPTPTLAPGANLTFFGLATSSDLLIDPAFVDELGRPVYELRFGSSFVLVIEGRPGTNHKPVGLSAFNYDPSDPTARPDLQVIVSRPLGNGSALVCDNGPADFGGVPAEPDFSETQTISDAINDLGCRFNDGTGNPGGRSDSLDACTQFSDGEFHFVDTNTTVQFCAGIAVPFRFPSGETVITARLRDTGGVVGPAEQIVVRVNPNATPTRPLASATPTATPTALPPPGANGVITFLGLAFANDLLVTPIGPDTDDRPIYAVPFGRGFNLVVEARPLTQGQRVGATAFAYDPSDPTLRPDLQVLLSRQLGDGSPDVCDNTFPALGGVPAVDPPDFSLTEQISGAINDFGCRFNDGTGNPSGRSPENACTVFTDGTFHFVDPTTTVQFCAPIVSSTRFPPGNTIVSARIRNGPVRQIVVRITG